MTTRYTGSMNGSSDDLSPLREALQAAQATSNDLSEALDAVHGRGPDLSRADAMAHAQQEGSAAPPPSRSRDSDLDPLHSHLDRSGRLRSVRDDRPDDLAAALTALQPHPDRGSCTGS